jgi:hypothetical protein
VRQTKQNRLRKHHSPVCIHDVSVYSSCDACAEECGESTIEFDDSGYDLGEFACPYCGKDIVLSCYQNASTISDA